MPCNAWGYLIIAYNQLAAKCLLTSEYQYLTNQYQSGCWLWQRQLYTHETGTCHLNKIQKLDLGLPIFLWFIVRHIENK